MTVGGQDLTVGFRTCVSPTVLRSLNAGDELEEVSSSTRWGDTGTSIDWGHFFHRDPSITTLILFAQRPDVEDGLPTDLRMLGALNIPRTKSTEQVEEQPSTGTATSPPREDGRLSSEERAQLLPNLEDICLHGLTFDGRTHDPNERYSSLSLFGQIITPRTTRRAKGAILPSITLVNAKMLTAEMVKQLEEVVGTDMVYLENTTRQLSKSLPRQRLQYGILRARY
ncbi:hypothetical protein BDV98DRAFT_135460 [Pterulicium gracile]|uniref:Uncharacterized protein n=1 Tax=Pterulicium gracile TaxID=1884261 RepID=A0A5C3QF46_9AGAR|nr:hypothetical protein BDV98DRAFT_135460 [Pterula gracilis]